MGLGVLDLGGGAESPGEVGNGFAERTLHCEGPGGSRAGDLHLRRPR